MARAVADGRLQDRSARTRLKPRHYPYWRSISEGRHLGYYRGKRTGSWIARCRAPNDKDYVTRPLGAADHMVEADGEAGCDFCDMTVRDLLDATKLPEPTLRDNIVALARQGTVETFRDDDDVLWVTLPQ